jgi:hypothetical protein
MRKWLLAIALVAMAVVILFLLRRPQPPAQAEQESAGTAPVRSPTNRFAHFHGSNGSPESGLSNVGPNMSNHAATVPLPQKPDPRILVSPLYAAPGSPPPDIEPSTILENVRTCIRQYGSMFDGNPVGNNQEITRALDGDNPKGAKFLNPESGMRINALGELIDSWGTPYFFHQLSKDETEIRSAGPDKTMWTADDLVIK